MGLFGSDSPSKKEETAPLVTPEKEGLRQRRKSPFTKADEEKKEREAGFWGQKSKHQGVFGSIPVVGPLLSGVSNIFGGPTEIAPSNYAEFFVQSALMSDDEER